MKLDEIGRGYAAQLMAMRPKTRQRRLNAIVRGMRTLEPSLAEFSPTTPPPSEDEEPRFEFDVDAMTGEDDEVDWAALAETERRMEAAGVDDPFALKDDGELQVVVDFREALTAAELATEEGDGNEACNAVALALTALRLLLAAWKAPTGDFEDLVAKLDV